jgi:hypothetical protein
MKDKHKAILRRLRDDPEFYLERLLWIKTDPPEEKLAPFKLRPIQREYLRDTLQRRAQGNPVRDVILKARQVGFSTLSSGIIFQDTATHKNADSLILCYDEDSTALLFEKSRLFYETLPDALKPMKRYSNRRELVFENPDESARAERPGLRSSIRVALARNYKAGRSRTLKHVHLSDAAFFDHLKALIQSVLPAIPQRPETSLFIESSPNVFGDDFHKFYNAAKRGENGFRAVFFPWFREPKYTRPFTDEAERRTFLDSLTEDEDAVRNAHALTGEQLHWRRLTSAQYDSLAHFLSQYPENDIDCFLSAGRTVFSKDKLRLYYEATEKTEPKLRGDLHENDEGAIRFEKNPEGSLKIWVLPIAGRRYAIGGDVAEGLQGGDYSCAEVVDIQSLEQVAEWHGHIDPDLFGDVLYRLGWYYNQAVIGPEVNDPGLTTITSLKKRYGRIFTRRVPNRIDPSKTDVRLGWRTNTSTKDLMENYGRQLMREDGLTIRSRALVEELLSYVVHEDGSTGANVSCFDDRVIAFLIALQIARQHRIDDVDVHELRKAKRRVLLSQFSE